MSTLSTHVLDTTLGHPAKGVPVQLSRVSPPATGRPSPATSPDPAHDAPSPSSPPDPTSPQPNPGRPLGTPLPSADTTADSSAVGSGTTDSDGRIAEFTSAELAPGTYQLRFDTAAYASATKQDIFFPEVTVTFTITDERHYHVPLLLSPFAFSTYRGS